MYPLLTHPHVGKSPVFNGQMANNCKEEIKVDHKAGRARGLLRVVGFIDHQFHIAHIPSLNLTAYGDTEKEALEMLFQDIVHDFFDNLLKLPESEIISELAKYGFQKSGFFKKRFTGIGPYVESSKLLTNLNLPPETKIKEQYLQVA
jgi:hypothetical protein